MTFVANFKAKVVKLENKERVVRSYKPDPEKDQAVVITEKLGWFVQLEGFQESWCVAEHTKLANGKVEEAPKPELDVGQLVQVTLVGLKHV